MIEKLYTLKIDIASNELDELIMQLDTIREHLYDDVEKKKENIQGIANGTWSIDFEERCEWCHGSGEVATDVDDGEGHLMHGVGSEKCQCRTD